MEVVFCYDVSSYREIIMSSSLQKLFDSLVTVALTRHLSYIPNQHAYIKGRSTTTNLIEFTHAASTALSSNIQLDVIYTDFSKAFDRVNHSTL